MMKKKMSSLILLVTLCCSFMSDTGAAQTKAKSPAKKTAPVADASDDDLKVKLDAILLVTTAAERVAALEEFVKTYPQSAQATRAAEHLTGARAALGDELLGAGDAAGGVKLFRLAVAEAPAEMSDKLFANVVSQLPANLALRGAGAAAIELAREVENRVGQNPKRLLALAGFYMSVERADEAMRLAEAATKLAPEMAAAHAALGASLRVGLKLDEASASFARALELDPQFVVARRSLADLHRASGRAEEALKLYRAQLASDPKDAGARAGLVLSLFDAGKSEEAEKELQSALADDPRNLQLLVGAAYFHAAHGDSARALDLAKQAVTLEPRYTWSHVALARALVAQKRPLEAEGALRFARRYGRFPTLDYELASAMAAAGLYEEAAEQLALSFTLKDGSLETLLAGRTPARAENFVELLAPERRASIFQHAAADTDANAKMLKSLLAFHLATRRVENSPGAQVPAGDAVASSVAATTTATTSAGVAEAAEFAASGDEETRAFRQLYAADRLQRRGAPVEEVMKLLEGAMTKVDPALASPAATMALMADEMRDYRARLIAAGQSLTVPDVPRNVLSNILRGRLEEAAGWSEFLRGNSSEAVVRLRRAAGVLPEASPWWRAAQWRLGAALDASGDKQGALAAYLKSYDRRAPDPARRAFIEAFYKKVNGSLDGLDDKIGAATPMTTTPAAVSSNVAASAEATTTTPPATAETAKQQTEVASNAEPTSAPEPTPTPEQQIASATTTPPPAAPEPTPEATPDPTSQTASSSSSIAPPSATSSSPTETPKQNSEPDGSCVLSVVESELAIKAGGSASVTVTAATPEDAAKLKAATTNWADIIVLAETPNAEAGVARKFQITSINKTPGTFTVTFSAPCGKREVKVTVQ